jgi:hypothetical protein
MDVTKENPLAEVNELREKVVDQERQLAEARKALADQEKASLRTACRPGGAQDLHPGIQRSIARRRALRRRSQTVQPRARPATTAISEIPGNHLAHG